MQEETDSASVEMRLEWFVAGTASQMKHIARSGLDRSCWLHVFTAENGRTNGFKVCARKQSGGRCNQGDKPFSDKTHDNEPGKEEEEEDDEEASRDDV